MIVDARRLFGYHGFNNLLRIRARGTVLSHGAVVIICLTSDLVGKKGVNGEISANACGIALDTSLSSYSTSAMQQKWKRFLHPLAANVQLHQLRKTYLDGEL